MDFIPFSTRLKSKLEISQPESQPQPASSSTPSAEQKPCAPEPAINLVRDGDKVTRIEIRCKCGELISLDCSY